MAWFAHTSRVLQRPQHFFKHRLHFTYILGVCVSACGKKIGKNRCSFVRMHACLRVFSNSVWEWCQEWGAKIDSYIAYYCTPFLCVSVCGAVAPSSSLACSWPRTECSVSGGGRALVWSWKQALKPDCMESMRKKTGKMNFVNILPQNRPKVIWQHSTDVSNWSKRTWNDRRSDSRLPPPSWRRPARLPMNQNGNHFDHET